MTRYRVRYRDPDGRQRSKTFVLRAEAEAFQAVTRADIIRSTYIDPVDSRTTYGEYAFSSYLPSRDWAPSTHEQAESHLRRWIIPVLGKTPLAKVTPTQLDEITVKCRRAGLSASTVEIVYIRATNILKCAEADGLIRSAPRSAQRPRRVKARPDEEVIPLARSQVNELVDAAPDHLRAFVWVMIGAGLRPGEAAGLSADRINVDTLEIRIDRALKTPNNGSCFLGPPKTDASRRTVPIGERLAEILTDHIDQYEGVNVPDASDTLTRLIFTSSRGAPLRRSTLSDYWRRWRPDGCQARGWHVCRHTHASALLEAGESIVVVQRRLGHASAQETLAGYAHLMPGSDDRSRSALDSWLGGGS